MTVAFEFIALIHSLQVRREDGNPLVKKVATMHHPADDVQPLVYHRSLLFRILHMDTFDEE